MMKIKWEEKRTYEEEIAIQDIIEYMEDNDYSVSTLMFARTIVKEWLSHFGKYSLDKYPESVIEQIAEILLKTIEEQKVTLEDIEEEIDDLICNLPVYFPKLTNKKDKILEMIEKYKNGE